MSKEFIYWCINNYEVGSNADGKCFVEYGEFGWEEISIETLSDRFSILQDSEEQKKEDLFEHDKMVNKS